MLGYRLLNDLRRGWRNNNPNLDQLGLLRISCRHVDEFAGAASEFKNEILQHLLPAQRAELLEFVIDQMRQTQCIQSRYFNPNDQEKTRTAAFSGLNERWSFSLEEHLTTTKYLTFDKIRIKSGLRAEMVSGGQQSRLFRSLGAPFWQQTEYARKISSIKSADLVEMLTELPDRPKIQYRRLQRTRQRPDGLGAQCHCPAVAAAAENPVQAPAKQTHQYLFPRTLSQSCRSARPRRPPAFRIRST